MLATQMTAEEEESVQSELEQLEREAGIRVDEPQKEEPTVKLPSAPQTEPVSQVPVEAEPQRAKLQAQAEERQAVLA